MPKLVRPAEPGFSGSGVECHERLLDFCLCQVDQPRHVTIRDEIFARHVENVACFIKRVEDYSRVGWLHGVDLHRFLRSFRAPSGCAPKCCAINQYSSSESPSISPGMCRDNHTRRRRLLRAGTSKMAACRTRVSAASYRECGGSPNI